MLQDILLTAAAAVGGAANNADALSKMGFSHLMDEMVSQPGEFFVSWVVFLMLVVMSFGSWWYTVVNAIKNTVVAKRADTVVRTFWETPNAQDAIRFMEEQPANEPFSKIALDCAQAAAHPGHAGRGDGPGSGCRQPAALRR